MYQSVPYNFLALPDELSSYKTAKVAVLPIPYESTLTHESGTRQGPMAIINASRQVETYDDELGLDPSSIGIATLPELDQVVSSPEDMQEIIYGAGTQILRDGKYLLALGGEHSITVALVKAHMKHHGRLSVVQLDAHSDLRDSYQGSRFSHACVMARVAEMTSFISVGVRSFCGCPNEKKYEANTIRPQDLRTDINSIKKSLAMLEDSIYITIDLDGFDPSVIPAVGTPEPGGLMWDDVMNLLNIVAADKKIIGADIVELSPRPGLFYADNAAAKLAYKIIAKSFFKG